MRGFRATAGMPTSVRAAAIVLVTFPLWLQAVYALSSWVNSNKTTGNTPYMDGECLLKAVNATNPVHFARHPVWPARGYSSDCDVHKYMEANFQNPIERKVMLAIYALEILIGVAAFVRYGLPKRLLELLMISIVVTSFHFLCYHYKSDTNPILGGVVHHTGVLPAQPGVVCFDGALWTIMALKVFMCAMTVVALKLSGSTLPFADILKVAAIVHPLKGQHDKLVHAYIHKYEHNLYPWFLYGEYEGHGIRHHYDGTWLGICDLPGISTLFDTLLYTQGWLYSSGKVKVGEPSHVALGYVLDMALVVFLTLALIVYLGVTERLWRLLAGPRPAAGKEKAT